MPVMIEVAAGQQVSISDSVAKGIIEQVMTLCEDLSVHEDDEVVGVVEEIAEYLEKHNLLS